MLSGNSSVIGRRSSWRSSRHLLAQQSRHAGCWRCARSICTSATCADQRAHRPVDMHRLQIGRAAHRSGPARGPAFRTAPASVLPIWESSKASCCASSSFCSASSRAAFTSSGICLRSGGGGRAGALGVFEGEGRGIADVAHQLQRGFEIRVAFAGKADDEIRRQRDVGPRGADALDQAAIIVGACAGGSSPPAPRRSPTAPADADRASACRLSPWAAIRSSPMSRGWLVV